MVRSYRMDRQATKSHGEREDEEVERLVRTSPKVKPPRHDRRRERVEVDADPDLDRNDKDLSQNFKDIGGSIAARIVRRWAATTLPAPTPGAVKKVPAKGVRPKAPAPAGKGAKPPDAPAKKVKVRSKSTGWVGWISAKRLKEEPANYELAEDAAEETFKPNSNSSRQAPSVQSKPQSEAQPSAQPKPEAEAESSGKPKPPQSEDESSQSNPARDLAARDALRALANDDPGFASFLKSFRKPDSDVSQFAKNNPGFGAKPFMQGKDLPEGIRTIGDLARVVTLQGEAPKPKKGPKQPAGGAPPPGEPTEVAKPEQKNRRPKKKPASPSGTQPPPAAAPDQPPPQTPAPTQPPPQAPAPTQPPPQAPAAQPAPAASGPAPGQQQPPPPASGPAPGQPTPPAAGPPPAPSTQPGAAPAQPTAPAPGAPAAPPNQPAPSRPTYIPSQPDRKVTQSELEAADQLVMRTFPEELAAEIVFARNPRYHPDEIQQLVKDYNLAKAVPVPGDISSLVNTASAFYATDPTKVPRPTTVTADDGSTVALKSLKDPVERAKAIRKHQVQTVAMSMAAQSAVAGSFEKQGASKDLAQAMSSFVLSGAGESPQDRDSRATARAEQLFYDGLKASADAPQLSDGAVEKLMQSNDPALKKLVAGYCQAQDYREARKRFLSPESDAHISEQQSPDVIAKRITKATDFLRKRSERYSAATTSQDTHRTFRDRVLKHLGNLRPAKRKAVQELLDVGDNRQYDRDLQSYDKALKAFRAHQDKAKQAYEAEKATYARLKKTSKGRASPPLSVKERLEKKKIVAPKRPAKPPRYDAMTSNRAQLGKPASGLWSRFLSRFASDQSVARRVAFRHAFSIYPATCAMDRSAVYWGVAPYPKDHEGFEPYREWEQPQARDLGEPDYKRLLKAARVWLSTPALSTKIEGVVRDTQLRAALDLALRAENYDHAIHPTVYNKLLARLAGVAEDETLLTVQSKTARNTMSNKNLTLKIDQADEFLSRLDRMASVVQSSHKTWGMTFTAAKKLVNAIDQLADDFERATYGAGSLLNRQASAIGSSRLAQVIQRESDEKYMETFKNPMKPIQTEADEPYMRQYGDDQSSAVNNGKSTTGRPLAP